MATTIKIRTQLREGVATVRALIKHPMAIGRRGRGDDSIEAHFITEVVCLHNDNVVMTGHWGAGISKNPYLSFMFAGASKGDEVTIRWIDNQEASDSITVAL